MQSAKEGDVVTVHYIGTLDNGRIFDQRDGDEPLSFKLGAGEEFSKLEREIVDMQVGEVKNIHLPCLVFSVDGYIYPRKRGGKPGCLISYIRLM